MEAAGQLPRPTSPGCCVLGRGAAPTKGSRVTVTGAEFTGLDKWRCPRVQKAALCGLFEGPGCAGHLHCTDGPAWTGWCHPGDGQGPIEAVCRGDSKIHSGQPRHPRSPILFPYPPSSRPSPLIPSFPSSPFISYRAHTQWCWGGELRLCPAMLGGAHSARDCPQGPTLPPEPWPDLRFLALEAGGSDQGSPRAPQEVIYAVLEQL